MCAALHAPADARIGQSCRSEETRIDDLSVHFPGELAEFMGFGTGAGEDVQDGYAANQQGIGEQPAVTLPPDRFGTHHGRAPGYGKRQELLDPRSESIGPM
jgi:hypothetical protein